MYPVNAVARILTHRVLKIDDAAANSCRTLALSPCRSGHVRELGRRAPVKVPDSQLHITEAMDQDALAEYANKPVAGEAVQVSLGGLPAFFCKVNESLLLGRVQTPRLYQGPVVRRKFGMAPIKLQATSKSQKVTRHIELSMNPRGYINTLLVPSAVADFPTNSPPTSTGHRSLVPL